MTRTCCIPMLLVLAQQVHAQERYVVRPLDLSPAADDYAPVLVDSTLVFCSLRERDHLVGYRSETTGKPLSDLYRVDLRSGADRSPALLGDALTSDLHDGPATFSEQGRTICFTRNLASNRKLGNTRATDDKVGLFFSSKIGRGWTVPEPFPFNGQEFSVLHPAFSPDGQRLYFASDMPGGQGGFDLYACERSGQGWEVPVNLGPAVNGPGNEVFPFVAANGTLYFSSERRGGLGGLDILSSRPDGSGWSSPVLLPAPLNSPGNDLGYTSFRSDLSGYLSSDRDGGDRLYSFERMITLFDNCPEQQTNNRCYRFNAPTDQSLANLPLIARWNMGDGTVITGGAAEHCYAAPGTYDVHLDLIDSVTHELFFSLPAHALTIVDHVQAFITVPDTVRSGQEVVLDGAQSHLPGFTVESYHWDLGDGTSASGPSVTHTWRRTGSHVVRMSALGLDKDGIHLKGHCVSRTVVVMQRFQDTGDAPVLAQYQDAAGATRDFAYQSLPFDAYDMSITEGEDVSFSIELFASRERLSLDDPKFTEVRKLYRVIERFDPERGKFIYSVGDSKDLAGLFEIYRKVKELQFLDAEAVAIHAEKVTDLSALRLMEQEELDNTLVRENAVHFAFGKADIAPDFEPRLKELADLMRSHPGMSMVVEAHTDAVGGVEENLELSQRRAMAIVDHLAALGIGRDRFVPVGHGENHPIASNDHEAGRGLNRRVEFRIQLREDQAMDRGH